MLNFSKTGTFEEAIAAIRAIPSGAPTLDESLSENSKAIAIQAVESLKNRHPTLAGVSVQLRASASDVLKAVQIELQITGRKTLP